jgi:hypothetical protein
VTAGGFPQNYFKNLACFSACENDRQPTTICHPFTTTSPQKHHAKTPISPGTPLKNANKPQKPPFPAAHKFF